MTVDRDQALDLLRDMLLIRRFEEKAAEMYSAGKIRGFLHLYIGEEAVAVGANRALLPEDNIVATYREHGHALVCGISPESVMAEMYGKASGCSRGRGGSMHLFDAEHRFFGGHAIVGGGIPVAVGLALADRMRNREALTACFFGDGAVDEGEFHESMNLAALWKLPVLFLCENNQYAMGTAIERHSALTDLCTEPRAYGIDASRVNGMDVLAVRREVGRAAAKVRASREPCFLELTTYRFRAHSMYDAELYRAKGEIVEWSAQHDPIVDFRSYLRAEGWLSDEEEGAMEEAIASSIQRAVDAAEAAPLEPIEDLTRDVYTPEAP